MLGDTSYLSKFNERGWKVNFDLLKSLEDVQWEIALRTFGNPHKTLVGLLVQWWIAGDSRNRSALDSGPAFGYRPRNEGGGTCDAILVERDNAKGIVEVEGSKYESTIKKMGNYFKAECQEYKSLDFGIFLAYPIAPEGRGKNRKIKPLPLSQFFECAKDVTERYPDKELAIILLEKEYERVNSGIRFRSEYYWCSPSKVWGVLIRNGKEVDRRTFATGVVSRSF